MQLTLFTDYALRTLVFLALQPEKQLSTITEVADRFTISRNHVVKIVHQLGMKGYIETQGESMSVHFSLVAVIPATMTCSR